jgi:hypothetical protein
MPKVQRYEGTISQISDENGLAIRFAVENLNKLKKGKPINCRKLTVLLEDVNLPHYNRDVVALRATYGKFLVFNGTINDCMVVPSPEVSTQKIANFALFNSFMNGTTHGIDWVKMLDLLVEKENDHFRDCKKRRTSPSVLPIVAESTASETTASSSSSSSSPVVLYTEIESQKSFEQLCFIHSHRVYVTEHELVNSCKNVTVEGVCTILFGDKSNPKSEDVTFDIQKQLWVQHGKYTVAVFSFEIIEHVLNVCVSYPASRRINGNVELLPDNYIHYRPSLFGSRELPVAARYGMKIHVVSSDVRACVVSSCGCKD